MTGINMDFPGRDVVLIARIVLVGVAGINPDSMVLMAVYADDCVLARQLHHQA